MEKNNHWGLVRANAKTRGRRFHIGAATLVMLGFPFLLDAGSRLYLNMGGMMPDGGFPLWLPLLFWAAEITVAAATAVLVFRGSDEFERQALVEAGAVGSSVLILLLPPLFFMGKIFDSHHSEVILGLWAVVIIIGALVYRARLKRYRA